MFRFFRQIRHKLFLEGKASRYLGYAIGEIVLIVVGILIALQIGDWNEARSENELRDTYIDRLLNEIELDRGVTEVGLRYSELRISWVDLLLDSLDDSRVIERRPVEFLIALKEVANVVNPTLRSRNTFEELLSTGYLRLLDDEVKSEFYSYYSGDERQRQRSDISNRITSRFLDLSSGILNPEQNHWIQSEIGFANVRRMDEISSLTYDGPSPMGALERLRVNEVLIAFLPTVQNEQVWIRELFMIRLEKHTTLIEMLKARRGDRGHI